jgi:hypothetical protein
VGMQLCLLVFAVMFLVAGRTSASVAAPHVIILRGEALSTPIVMDDWWKYLELMLGLGDATHGSATGESHIVLNVEMFWGPAVEQHLANGVNPLDLPGLVEPDPALLYLPLGSEPPILGWRGGFSSLGPGALAALDSYGISDAVGVARLTPPSTGSGGLLTSKR